MACIATFAAGRVVSEIEREDPGEEEGSRRVTPAGPRFEPARRKAGSVPIRD